MKSILRLFLITCFSLSTVYALEVRLADPNPIEFIDTSIIQLEVFIDNLEEQPVTLEATYIEDVSIIPIRFKNELEIAPYEKKTVSYYFKVDRKIVAGTHQITINFKDAQKSYEVSRQLNVSPNTKIRFSKSIFDSKNIQFIVENDSNHPVTILGKEINAYSSKTLNYKFQNSLSFDFYSDKIPVYYNGKEIQTHTIFSKIPRYGNQEIGGNEEFIFPVHIGSVFSNQKSKGSYTLYVDGGGQFSKNQEIHFKFSQPFYSGQDPYLFYDPLTAIFYLNYRFKNLKLIAGDSSFENNNYLYYRTGRGYIFDYDDPDLFRMRFGYITRNKFYNAKAQDYIVTLQTKQNPELFYYSFNRSNHYNQNIGINWNSGDNKNGLKSSLQFFNSDFNFNKHHSGVLGTLSVQTDTATANVRADYLGDHFYGLINSELRMSANVQKKFEKQKLSTNFNASYQNLFPVNNPDVKITNYSAGITKSIWGTSNSLNFDYLQYDNDNLNRKNYSGYYGFTSNLGKYFYLNFNQGATYSKIIQQLSEHDWKTFSKVQLNFHVNRFNTDFGFLSQVRYFSESQSQENSFFLGSTYNFDAGRFYLNFSVSNSTFDYKPYINANYKTRIKVLDIELDYTLIPQPTGYDWRSLVKLDFTRYFKIKKGSEKITKVYDSNSNSLINKLSIRSQGDQMIQINQGKITNNLSDEELKAIQFASLESQRKFIRHVKKDLIENEYIYHIDYRVNVVGNLSFSNGVLRRSSLDKLIFSQSVYAESESGALYYGSVNSDGRFVIPGLPIGRYRIGVISENLPEIVKIQEKTITTTYDQQTLSENIIISY